MMANDSRAISTLLDSARRITVLTGAGVSTDAGIPDFRSTDRHWDFEEPREAMISAPFWRKNPRRFWEVYRSTLRATEARDDLEPTDFHRWLVALEAQDRVEAVNILTQNVDGLHSRAGSSSVIEAHGNSSRAICMECGLTVPMESIAGNPLPTCAACDNFPVLKPDVSLFLEGVSGLSKFRKSIYRCNLLIVAGTSLTVSPVNELPLYAQNRLRPTLWISDEEPPAGYYFTAKWVGRLSDFVDSFPL